jgi:nitrous oxidase accessory protein NosD
VTGQTGPTGAAATVEPCLVEDATSGRFFGTFQAAVNAASGGDTLNVQGTCEGDTTIGKSLTIQGQGPGATLNGENQSGSVITIFQGAVSISGLTITGGNANVGGGIRILGEPTVTLTNSTVTGNRAVSKGGGIYEEGGTLTLTNSTVSGNTAPAGGGGGGIYSAYVHARITLILISSTVSGNTARYGGGIYLGAGTAHIEEKSSVTGNTAGREGGGIFKLGSNTLTIEHPEEVSGNTPENGY